jgi:hypothetical protein
VTVVFINAWENPRTGEYLEHRNGVAWHDAPPPRRGHRCVEQSRGFVLLDRVGATFISRCACGAVDIGDGWAERNTRTPRIGTGEPSCQQ